MQKTCPSWLEVTPDGFAVKEEAAAVVRRIFGMARDGLGISRIADRLTRDGVPPIGTCGRWARPYVYRVLTSPAAMGTYQPQRNVGKRKTPDGPPIPGHYPAVVSEEDWRAAQDAIGGGPAGPGRGAGGVTRRTCSRDWSAPPRTGRTWASSTRSAANPFPAGR